MKTKTFQTVVKAIAYATRKEMGTQQTIAYIQQLTALDYDSAYDQLNRYLTDRDEKLCTAVDAMIQKMQKKQKR